MSQFLFQLDDHQFLLPWTRPDWVRLRLWYRRMHRDLDVWSEFELFLFGGFWSNQSAETWDVDIFLTPRDGQLRIDDLPFLRRVHEIMLHGYQLALNEFRFLIDVTYCTSTRIDEVFAGYRQFELDDSKPVVSPESRGYTIFLRYKKIRHGAIEFEYEKDHSRIIELGESMKFVERINLQALNKQAAHMKKNRVYYSPTPFADLFDLG